MSLLRTFSFKPPHQVSHEDMEIILQSKQKPFLPVEEEDVLLTRFESMLQWIYDSRNSMILRIYGSILASVTPKARLGYKFSSVWQNKNRSHSCSNRNAIHEILCEKVLAWHESLSRRRKRWAVGTQTCERLEKKGFVTSYFGQLQACEVSKHVRLEKPAENHGGACTGKDSMASPKVQFPSLPDLAGWRCPQHSKLWPNGKTSSQLQGSEEEGQGPWKVNFERIV